MTDVIPLDPNTFSDEEIRDLAERGAAGIDGLSQAAYDFLVKHNLYFRADVLSITETRFNKMLELTNNQSFYNEIKGWAESGRFQLGSISAMDASSVVMTRAQALGIDTKLPKS